MDTPQSLYIHIPFCRKKCPYCDFYSVEYDSRTASSYIDALKKQLDRLGCTFLTIYIGGGTPSILDAPLWEKLFSGLRKKVLPTTEFSIEVNPESLDREKLKLFRDHSVNRLSIGVQSFSDKKLELLGRVHTASQGRKAILLAKEAGFINIGIDCIYGVWHETLDEWRLELKEIVRMPVTHVSLYSLTYENSTPLYIQVQSKKIIPLDEEAVAEMFRCNMEYLQKNQFCHYEVSNYAREGYECRHNINYWNNNSSLGLGAGAVSYINGRRCKNISDLSKYIKGVFENSSVSEACENLSDLERARETAALKIRTKKGIDFAWFKNQTGFDFLPLQEEVLGELLEKDLIVYKYDNGLISGIQLTPSGFLFCDAVSSSLV
jgi:oxygen-independent coproporphyrinogen-3 oxidase